MLFRLSSVELGLLLFTVVLGSTPLASFAGHRLRGHSETLREPFGVLQAALLGFVALILSFGLTMAVGRYDSRRAAVVADANAIGTTYLRAQTLREPIRTRTPVDSAPRLYVETLNEMIDMQTVRVSALANACRRPCSSSRSSAPQLPSGYSRSTSRFSREVSSRSYSQRRSSPCSC